jgi:HD-GYP domain-containing protein (c-di-GMP phosphodiesterase class II)
MFQHRSSEFVIDSSQAVSSLAEILGAFSYALDLTEGQPAGHSIRACWIGTKLAQAIGLEGDELHDIYYAVLLKDLGCSVNAARVAEMFVGDDRTLKASFKLIGPDQEDFAEFIMNEVGVKASADIRDGAIANLYENGADIMTDIMATRCTRGADIARSLRFSEDVATAIAHLDEHWDGSGLPLGIAGENIHIGGRIALIAQVADVFFNASGAEAAMAEIRARSGTWLDPRLCDIFLQLASSSIFWVALASETIEEQLFAMEPAMQSVLVDEDYLDDIANAFGQVIDAKSPFTGGHSERVGHYTDLVAAELGLDAQTRRSLRRAAMLHDVGKLAVSSMILEKPGKLDAQEWEVMQSHALHTFNILSKISPMRDMAVIAAAHHERLDGKGYPLGIDDSIISVESRIITICDIFDALTADRPYRAAMSVEEALAVIEDEIGIATDEACFVALKTVVAQGVPQLPLPQIGSSLQ